MDKKTALFSFHSKLNAKMVSFAGYLMPIQYKGVKFEHNFVRNNVGLFDISHMAQIIINGDKAFDLLQKITTNDVSKLVTGKVQYSCMTNQNGGIIDDFLLYKLSNTKYMLVVNASNAQKDFDWICSHNVDNVDIIDVTDSKSIIAVQGPKSIIALQKITNIDLSLIPYYSFSKGSLLNYDNIIISNTGYTGELGFELYVDRKHTQNIWDALFENNDLIEPIGLAARDTLRLEKSFCLYGNDIDENRTPIEAGLSWIVNFNKEFIGKKKLLLQKQNGVINSLVSFIMLDKGIPRQDYPILDTNDNKIGVVTSGTMSPSIGKAIGMGYINVEMSKYGNHIFILIRNKKIKAVITNRIFDEKKK